MSGKLTYLVTLLSKLSEFKRRLILIKKASERGVVKQKSSCFATLLSNLSESMCSNIKFKSWSFGSGILLALESGSVKSPVKNGVKSR